ncbi:hypothetical protein BLNAU_5461 [Blattamonas nauphoetae]|uniref:Protein kinase domain-containing protein n=1 Tax=Blattamonas nauphoetae TaxID=2049346 RepID=A0ABQ9Y7M3_9EUKA|nr:hypothetical protein BLNAU_5461 [Blattamonas nauphoetae]
MQEPLSNSLEESTFVASILNTSLSMEGFIFHLMTPKHAMIEVDSSTLSVSECTILTEGSLSPFVISSGGGSSSSSISILSTKFEPTSRNVISLPPLTSLARPSKQHTSTRSFAEDGFDAATTVVHGSGLHLDDIYFRLGTGPLFDFGVLSPLFTAVPSTTISLTHSSLTNTSSLAPETTRRLFPQTNQILISCVVGESTNHFSGTAVANVNLCGSFLATNSSFAKCSSTLVESDEYPTYTLSHRTGTDPITAASVAQVQDLEITRCTFKDMSGSTNASSIHFSKTVGNTRIHECSFFNCKGTSAWGSAGAVYVCPVSTTYSVTFSSCVVVRCKCASANGVVTINDPCPFIASNCVFYQTESSGFGTAVTVLNARAAATSSVSNSIFESAFATSPTNGSALCFRTPYNLFISSLRFVDTQNDQARDFYVHASNFDFSGDCVENCQSSRSQLICEAVRDNVRTSHDDLFTTITKKTFVKSFSGIENGDDTATFTIEVGDAVTGEMVVVVENLDSTPSSPPPIPRSLTFDFGTAATTASCTVDVGDAELIQSPAAEYNIRRIAVNDWLVHTLRVKTNAISFNDDLETLIDISLDCDGLVRPGYSILVKTGGEDRTLSLAIGSDGKTLTATGRAYPISEAELKYASDYEIVSVKDLWGRALILPLAVNFNTPDEPPRLIKMTHAGFDSTGEHLIVRVRGRQMPVGTYTIKLTPGDLSFDVVFGSVKDGETMEERDSEPLSIPIYGENKKILFDTEYTITDASVKAAGTSIFVVQSETAMTTPSEPARITAITEETYDSLFTQLTLSFSGINCVATGHTMTVKNTATQKTHTFNVIFDTPQTGSRTEYIYNTGGTTNLTFGATYEVIGVTASTGQIFFTSGMTFTVVPARHRLLSKGTTTVDDDVTVVSIRMTGDNMPIGNTTLQLLDSTHYIETSESLYVNVEVSFSSGSDGLLDITMYPTPQLVYGHSYLAWSMNRTGIDDEMFVTTHFTIQMSTEPSRLVKIAQFDHLDDKKAISLSWEGRVMTNGPYTATLSVNGSSTTILTLTFNSDGTTSTTTETLYRNPSSVLKYNTKYVVTEVKDKSDTPVIVHSGITFTTNAEPTRLLSILSLENGDDLNTTSLTLSGHQLPAGDATLTVVLSSVPSGSETEANTITLPVSITQSGDDSTGTVSISLYPTLTLAYGETYRIVSLSSADYIDTPLTFKIPDEPSRLEKVTPVLSEDAKQVTLTFEGRVFASGVYELTLQPAASNTDFVVPLDYDGDGILSCSISTDDLVTPHVILGQVYTIAQITKNSNPIVINPKAKRFTAPVAALFKSISFEFTNSPCTSYKLVLKTENMTVNQNYILTLTSGETFAVTFSTPEEGETGSHAIGWGDTLQYKTEYTIDELREESSEAPIRKQADKFTTKPKPPTITLFVNHSSTSDDLMCGDQTNPCASIQKAWIIVAGLEHVAVTLKILKETKETESFVISKDISVLIENGMHVNGIIRIPASATYPDESALITVTEGTLKLQAVEVAVETMSESFVFLLGVNSTIVLNECVIDGMNIPPPNSNSLSVCEWTSGVIQLDNCTTTVDWTKFHELPQGALNMKGGRITIDDSIFRDNTPNHDLFPSARRNILCSGEGDVRIGKLRSGDGTEDDLSPWMALDDCHLHSTSVDGTKALFIPTLDSNKTKSKYSNESYDVSLVGSVLMPCGLGLEVMEWDEKAKVEKRSTTIELAGLNSSEWTDTSVNFLLDQSSIQDIDHTLEIRARLAFGHNQSTNNHIVLKISDAAEKKAQALEKTKKALLWLIPVIVAVVAFILILTIVLLCRRKRQQKDDTATLLKNQEMDQHTPIDVEKMEEPLGTVAQIREPHTNNMLNHNLPTTIGSSVLPAKDTLKQVDSQYSENRVHSDAKTKMAVRCEEELVEVPVNVNNTLYNRLHKGGPPLESQRVFRMITQGLAQIAKHNPKMPILTCLSPLWVFLDEQDTPLFQMKEESVSVQQNIREGSFFPGSEHKPMEATIVTQQEPLPQTLSTANASLFSQTTTANTSTRHIEEQRWVAPEVANKKVEIDTSKAAVFSLGLILWEMETGLVPFGEIDSVNAQRQLGTGSLPLMDSWTNQSKIELVRSCLSLDPKERPTLDEILSLLDSDAELGKPAMDKQNMDEC